MIEPPDEQSNVRYRRYVITKKETTRRPDGESKPHMAIIISSDGLEELLSPLGFTGHIVLGTWLGPRPYGYVIQHDGARDDDSLGNVYWLHRSLNYTTEYMDPK